MFQNLRNCPAVDAKTMGYFEMAQTIMMAGKTNPSVQIHVIHLPLLPLAMNKRRQNGGFHAATDRKSIRLRGPLLLRDLQRPPKRFMCGDGYQRIPSDEDIR